MATKTWYINQIGGRLYYDGDGGGVTNATSATGWTVGKVVTLRYSDLLNGTEQGTGTFGTTALPNTTAPTVNNVNSTQATYTPPNLLSSDQCIGLLYEYNVFIPAGTWTFNFPVIAVTSGGDQDGRIRIRVFKAARSGDTFTGTTELTGATQIGSTVTNLGTAVALTSTVTWSAPDIQLNNEFLLVKIAWEITGQGGANTRDVLMRYGVGSTMITPTFRKRSYNITTR